MGEDELYISMSGKILRYIDTSKVTFSIFNNGQTVYSRDINTADFSRKELHEVINMVLNDLHEESGLQTVRAYNKIKRR